MSKESPLKKLAAALEKSKRVTAEIVKTEERIASLSQRVKAHHREQKRRKA